MSGIYYENNIEEFGVAHNWYNAIVKDKTITRRGTTIEMVERPQWGLACYMDNSIQSCTVDERIYHESLVHPIMSSVKSTKRVCIIGGGEGATAREVFKFPGVEKVDMYEWDEDVVNLFKEKYPQWAKGAWNDSRLHLHYEDIFKAVLKKPSEKYDVIIIDLFEPNEKNRTEWETLLVSLQNWLNTNGAIVMYAGMRSICYEKQPYQYLIDMLSEKDNWHGLDMPKFYVDKTITPYRVWIPSFSGESVFILLSSYDNQMDVNKLDTVNSHMDKRIWKSYNTFNW